MEIFRGCRLCGKEHAVSYVNAVNGAKHLAMKCGKKIIFIPKEEDLEIPEYLSKKAKKVSAVANNLTLL